MLERLKWIDYTQQVDDNVTRVSRLLNTLILLAIGMAALSLVISALTNTPSPWTYLVLIATLILSLCSRVILHRGHVRLAAVTFLSILFIILGLFALYTGGLRAASFGALVLLTLYAGFMLGRNGALLYAAILILITIGLFLAEIYNLLPSPITQRPLGYLLAHLAGVIVGTTFVLYVMSNINRWIAELRRSEEQFREIFELAPIGMMTATLDGQFLRANQALCDTLGYTLEELRTLKFLEITHPDDVAKNRDLIEKLISGEISDYGIEKRYLRKDRSIVTAFLQGSLIRDAKGNPHQLIGQVVDLTERKRTEEALQQSQKLESLGVLAGGIAHDFNNLLTAMLAQSSLVQLKLPTDSPVLSHVEKIVGAAERAASLTQQMLAYAGRGQFQIQPLDLNKVIRDNLHLLDVVVSKNVHLERNLAKSLPLVDADMGQIQQVIMNLIINGAEAVEHRWQHINGHTEIQAEGRVVVKTEVLRVEDDEQLPLPYTGEALAVGDYVSVSITDNGIGMDAETQAKIFDPFFSTKMSGRGLGLAAVLGIVRLHKGGLHVESIVGQGTTFCIMLPTSETTLNELSPPTSQVSHNHLKDHLILVIDDEAPIRDTIVDIMHTQGVQTLTAADGTAGIDLYRQHVNDIHLIILDLSMPGLSGEETLGHLRILNPDVPILLSSGYSESESFTHLTREDVSGFLKKPYTWEQLIDTVQRHLA